MAEACLYTSGSSTRMGKIEEGNTVSDYHTDEIERRISINASLLHAEWGGKKINVIDTPGYSDFTGEVLCGLSAADTAALLLKSVEGVEVGTEIVWNYTKNSSLPTLLVVNKCDNENSQFEKTASSARERFGSDATILSFPLNEGLYFDTVVDLLRMKAYKYERGGKGNGTEIEIPADVRAKAETLHEELIEKIAETDETLLNKFFDEGTLAGDDLSKGLTTAFRERKIFPILCLSATQNVGTDLFMDFLASYAPSPIERGGCAVTNTTDGTEVMLSYDPSASAVLFVFKTVSEAHVGDLSFFKVISGTVTPGMDMLNTTNNKPERLGQLFVMSGKERKDVAKLVAGDIGAVVKLKDTHTNNTLALKSSPVSCHAIEFPGPVIKLAIKSKAKGDEEKISNGLHHLHEEDPTFVIEVDGKLSQTLIGGQGELHLIIQSNRLKSQFGVEVELDEPKIPYKETIKGIVADSEYKHKKQTGGRGQYGHVHLKIEPLPRGKGFEFEDAVVGGVVPGRFVPAVEKGVVEALAKGVLAGFEVVDIKVTLFDGTYHSVDSDELSFKLAASQAFKKGFLSAKPVILEPINIVEVTVPEEYMGDVMGDVSGRRGKILGMESDGHFQQIKAQIPMSELHKYATVLRSMTQGRGIYKTKFSHYEELPRDVAEKIIADRGKAKQEEE